MVGIGCTFVGGHLWLWKDVNRQPLRPRIWCNEKMMLLFCKVCILGLVWFKEVILLNHRKYSAKDIKDCKQWWEHRSKYWINSTWQKFWGHSNFLSVWRLKIGERWRDITISINVFEANFVPHRHRVLRDLPLLHSRQGGRLRRYQSN